MALKIWAPLLHTCTIARKNHRRL